MHDTLAQVISFAIAQLLKAQVYLAIGTHQLDEAFHPLAITYRFKDVIIVDNTPVLTVNDRFVADVGVVFDDEVDLLTFLITMRVVI